MKEAGEKGWAYVNQPTDGQVENGEVPEQAEEADQDLETPESQPQSNGYGSMGSSSRSYGSMADSKSHGSMADSRSYGSMADSKSHGSTADSKGRGSVGQDTGEWGSEGWSEGWADDGWGQEAESKASKGESVSSDWDTEDWGAGWEGTGQKKAGHSVENGWNDAALQTAKVD